MTTLPETPDPTTAATASTGNKPGGKAQTTMLRRVQDIGLAPLLVLVVLVVAIGAIDHKFFTARSFASLLEQSTPLALLAIGQCLVVLTGRIDLGNAALASLTGVLVAKALGTLGVVAVPLILIGGALAGALAGWVHVKAQVPSFIVTLGAMGVWSGLSLMLAQANTVLVLDGYQYVEWIFNRWYGIPISFVLVMVITVALMAALRGLPVGRQIKAVGLNERAAAYSGIRTQLIVILAFVGSGLFAALAAVFQTAQLQSAGASTSTSLLLPAIAAVIIGGTSISGGVGGVGRTLLGALVITVLRVGLDIAGVASAIQPILYGLIVIFAIVATVDRQRTVVVA
ncbi:ABC transporter permease [Mycobacterium aquaticum]|nr:ABC transporter permease [Mycobacterium aquaticum]